MALQTARPSTTPSPQIVANAFVEQYYHILHNSPDLVYRFYQDSSVLSRADSDGGMITVTTMQGINEKILSLDYKNYKSEIKTTDAQESYNQGLTVLVTGCLTGKDNLRKKFAQSFFLAPQDKGYFVLNDVFRYLEDGDPLDKDPVNGVESVKHVSPIRDDKMEDLSRMYKLYHEIPKGLEPVANIFKHHVTAEGNALVQQAEDAATNQAAKASGVQELVLIRNVIELHDKCMVYLTDCFQNHTLFHKALKEAFEIFCNKTVVGSSNAELLATFCDNILKKGGSKKLSDEAIEETLEKVVKLLAYISGKDLFAEFYRKKLARRLIFDRCTNEDHERSILTKLKQQYGEQFTSEMEGMVTDLTLERENQNNFEDYLANNPAANPGIDLTVTVLTTGFWPSYKSSDINLPNEMVRCVEVFKGFYESKTKHRKLTWIYSLGTCHINGKFEQKPIVFNLGNVKGRGFRFLLGVQHKVADGGRHCNT